MMETTELLGYASALLVGLTLGLTGGGGAILTVPIMVYLFGIDPVLATAYSLFVVGITSLVGSTRFVKRGLVTYRAAAVYGIPSLTAVFLTRRFLVPALPDPMFRWGDLVVSKDVAILVFFAVVMLAAAVSMIRDKKEKPTTPAHGINHPVLAGQGAVVGVVTGMVGSGGGFLIVPALALLANLPMKVAIGTSLVIITANSLIGFLGDVGHQTIEWLFLLLFTGLSIVGVVIGSYGSQHVSGDHLKQGFGWLVLVMGGFIIVKELLL